LVLVAGLWVAGVGVLHAQGLARGEPPILCLFRRVTDVPCPTCGTTRAAWALAAGDVVAALLLNPFMVIAGVVLAVVLVARAVTARRVRLDLGKTGRRVAWATVAVLFIANWAWVIWWHARA